MTKKSLNFESDLLYASWQHGMELLAHVWGSEESLEGMNAFLAGRKPDFQKFRMRNKRELEDYLDGCAKNLNAPPVDARKIIRDAIHERCCHWPARRGSRGRSDPHPGRPALHHDARRHGRRCHQGRAARHGDDTRGWGPPFVAGEAAYFLGVNRNKRSLTLNMAVPAGQKILAGLIEKADVLIDNFKLGTLAKWGFTDAWFEQQAPRLVRCSITGYGSSGPKAALPGYDFILQAESGLMSICGEPDGVPTKYGVAIVDVCTGMLACNSILAALNARQRTGKGQKVEVSLYETSLAMLVNVASNYCIAGRDGGRFGNGHPSIVPYTTYQAADAMIALGSRQRRASSRAPPRCSAIPNGRRIRALPATGRGWRTATRSTA